MEEAPPPNPTVDKPPSYDEAVKSGQYDEPFKSSGQEGGGGSGFGQQGPPGVGFYPNYGSTFPSGAPQTQVILVGGCPACRIGVLEDEFSILGILIAILFFPIGILCCLAMRQRRCSNCGAIFG